MVIAFIPMFLIALSFKYLNQADPDCGTTFSWATRAPAAYGGGETGDYRRALKEVAENATNEAVERIRDTGVDYEVELVPKRPVDALLGVAKERDAQMIVVGTQGEHPLTGAILGSVPHKLLHASTIPILCVPGKD